MRLIRSCVNPSAKGGSIPYQGRQPWQLCWLVIKASRQYMTRTVLKLRLAVARALAARVARAAPRAGFPLDDTALEGQIAAASCSMRLCRFCDVLWAGAVWPHSVEEHVCALPQVEAERNSTQLLEPGSAPVFVRGQRWPNLCRTRRCRLRRACGRDLRARVRDKAEGRSENPEALKQGAGAGCLWSRCSPSGTFANMMLMLWTQFSVFGGAVRSCSWRPASWRR